MIPVLYFSMSNPSFFYLELTTAFPPPFAATPEPDVDEAAVAGFVVG